ncbi:MAG: hypothetical protein ACKVIY_15835 [Acidimicrobiales bacterium]
MLARLATASGETTAQWRLVYTLPVVLRKAAMVVVVVDVVADVLIPSVWGPNIVSWLVRLRFGIR